MYLLQCIFYNVTAVCNQRLYYTILYKTIRHYFFGGGGGGGGGKLLLLPPLLLLLLLW